MKHYVEANCVNPADTKRKIERLKIAPLKSRGIKTQYQTRFKNLAEELEKLSLISGLGWDVYLDLKNKEFVFDVFEGCLLYTSGKNQEITQHITINSPTPLTPAETARRIKNASRQLALEW